MIHLTEEQLLFHYYGEAGETGETLETERHLDECDQCRALYGSLQRLLNVVSAMPAPERGPEYGVQVWRRIEGKLRARRLWWRWAGGPPVLRYALACAGMVALLTVAYQAGRFDPRPPAPLPVADDGQTSERVLRVAVGDYLDRSQMVLIELANTTAKGPVDISSEQERAGDLVSETRLYRQTAAHTGDTRVSSVLEELERVLVDITHAPSKISPQELGDLRRRLEAEGILFKIRVLGSNVRNQDVPAAQTAGQTL